MNILKLVLTVYSTSRLQQHPIPFTHYVFHQFPKVLLRWNIQRGVTVVPKSARPERIEENAAVFDFELSDDDVAAIDEFNKEDGGGRVILPLLAETDKEHPHYPFNIEF